MTHEKGSPLKTILEFLPVVLVLLSAFAGYIFLQARVSHAEEKVDKLESSQGKIWQDTTDIKVAQAREESKVDAMYEILKELKNK